MMTRTKPVSPHDTDQVPFKEILCSVLQLVLQLLCRVLLELTDCTVGQSLHACPNTFTQPCYSTCGTRMPLVVRITGMHMAAMFP